MADNSTTKFKADISELRAAMQEAGRQVRLANSEFKAATAGMDDWSKSADGISSKLKQLNSVLDAQEDMLANLKKQYELTAKEQGENSKGAQELLIKINNQKAAISKTNAEIKKWENSLEQVTSEEKDAEKATEQLDKALDDLDDTAQSLGDGFTVFKGVVADLVANGIRNLISGFADLAENSLEYQTNMGKLNTAFETNGHTAETAANAYKDLNSVLGDSDVSVEAANHLAKLTDNEKDLAKWTGDILPGVFATFGDSLPIEGLTEAANETAKVGQVTGPLADALNWAGISEDKFNESLEKCNSEQERQKLIMETLAKTYGEASEHYKETNADIIAQNKASDDLAQSYATLGAKATPIITALKQGFADLLGAALGMTEGVDFSGLATKVKEGFAYLIDTVLPKVKEGFEWIIDNKEILIGGITGLSGAFATWKAIGVASMIKDMIVQLIALVSAQEGATVAQKLLNLAMKANVIGIVVTAITGLVAAFIYLWNNCDEFRQFWLDLWEKVKSAFQAFLDWMSPAVEKVKEFFTAMWEKAKEAWDNIIDSLEPMIDSMMTAFEEAWELIQMVWDAVSPYFEGVWEFIKNVFSVVEAVLSGFFKSAWEVIKSVWDVAVSYFETIWDNIKEVFSVVKTFLGGAFETAWEAIKAVWNTATGFFKAIWDTIAGIFSVVKDVLTGNWSDAWEGIKGIVSSWGDFFAGVWDSIKKVFSSVKSWFGDTFSAAWKAIKNVFSNWGDFFSGLWDKIKSTFSKLGTNIADAISKSVKSGINGVISLIEGTINTAINLINGAINLINELPGVEVSKIKKLKLPRLEQGGILEKGQVGLLEGKGAEAVVPLHNNKKWIAKTAQDMKESLQKEGFFGGPSGSTNNVTNNYNLVQNNTSPKALSALDTYRARRQQIAMLKVKMGGA